MKPFTVTAPGRVCIFGEHSDYLGLDVIPAAINLAITIHVEPAESNLIVVRYTDLNVEDAFEIGEPLEYKSNRDYVRAAFNVMRSIGVTPCCGAKITITGDIPVSAGLSSSSALTVASTMMAAHMGHSRLDKRTTVELAYRAEVQEFNEGGGNQDHIASVYGGVIHLDSGRQEVTPLPAQLDGLVIGDSGEKKRDTVGDLKRIRTIVEGGYSALKEAIECFDQRTTPLATVMEHLESIPERNRRMTLATLQNRELTTRALALLRSPAPSPVILGRMIEEHHAILRDGLERSTPKIESMIEAANQAGALGCKMNGSGGGGTMLAYAPGNEDAVMNAIREAGGTPYKVSIGTGASLTVK